MITTVNFHLNKSCNFKCSFCYASFNDITTKGLPKQKTFELIQLLAESKMFHKINFAGGEPTLVPYITDLIQYAKSFGFETSIVTNASRIDFDWVRDISPHLDILTLSIDSTNKNTNIKSGRNQKKTTMEEDSLFNISKSCHIFGVELKINTVVTQFNKNENLAPFINTIKPFRWKILQATRVERQNDKDFDKVKVSSEEFFRYCSINNQNILPQIKVIKENPTLIEGSYLMVDPSGRFYDSTNKKHNYSDKILEVGVQKALHQVNTNFEKFLEREGNYSTLKII